jgi:V8-like Glu-specific endopeptidase
MATGWLVRPDLVVTAGHCVYDWRRKMKRAIRVQAYIGYDGKASVNRDGVQCRKGVEIGTTFGWLSSHENLESDVAFIKLDKPFTGNLNLFQYTETPHGPTTDYLGVVGYPADKSRDDERGAQMYEEFNSISYNIDTSENNMIEYAISTSTGAIH